MSFSNWATKGIKNVAKGNGRGMAFGGGLGAIGGAALGAGSNFVNNMINDTEGGYGRAMLTGAAIGGAVNAGTIGAIGKGWNPGNTWKRHIPKSLFYGGIAAATQLQSNRPINSLPSNRGYR